MNSSSDCNERDVEEARLLQRRLRAMFSAKQPLSEESARAVTQICDQALVTIPDEYCQEMFCEIDRYAQRLVQSGHLHPAALRVVLDAIQHRLESLRKTGDRIARAEVTLAKY